MPLSDVFDRRSIFQLGYDPNSNGLELLRTAESPEEIHHILSRVR